MRHGESVALALALVGCGGGVAARVPAEPPPDLPPTAKVDVWRDMAEDARAPRHASDGGGRVTIEAGPMTPPEVGSSARFTFRFEVGPRGIAEGGAVVFLSPPFWGWSAAQVVEPEAPGFTEVSTDAAGVSLEVDAIGQGLVRAKVAGRPLRAGEVLRWVYGAGPAAAEVDHHPEEAEPFWFGVDGDGDGVRAWVADPPTTAVVPGPPVGLWVTVPTTAHPGDAVAITVAALDRFANRAPAAGWEVSLDAGEAWALPPTVQLGSEGTVRLDVPAPAGGWVRVAARASKGAGEPIQGVSEAMLVHRDAPVVLWADLQVHSAWSDGSSTVEELYRYARDVAGLDAVAVTDHDHWGVRFLDRDPALAAAEVAAAQTAYAPGRFVTFPAFEWTSWLYGHRHVLDVGPPGPVVSSLDAATDTPAELWQALRGRDVLTISHHQAGGPVATDWRWRADPFVEPVAEVVSVHGSSEAVDSPGRIYGYVDGHSVRDALVAGWPLGFVGGTDGHDGHPGLAHLAGGSGGLTGIVVADREHGATREGIAAALRARHTYATNGVRVLLRLRAGAAEAGDELPAPSGPLELEARVVASERVERVELICGGPQGVPWAAEAAPSPPGPAAAAIVEQRFPLGAVTLERFTVDGLVPGAWCYVRARLVGGGAAWASPIRFGPPSGP
jgi:hypothetical protein